jgi:transcription initiation factor IIE alpha subunit
MRARLNTFQEEFLLLNCDENLAQYTSKRNNRSLTVMRAQLHRLREEFQNKIKFSGKLA